MIKSFFACLGAFLVAVILSGCTPVGVAAGMGVTVGTASFQEGGIKTAAKDTTIKLRIADAWIKHDFDIYRKLNLTVKEGRVLITGSVPNPDMRVDAIRLAWQADGVKQVINEISVDEDSSVGGLFKDSLITGSIATKIMFDKHIQSINYNIDTANGNVYVMGVAQNQKELDLVIEYARNTKNVTNVISYVRLSNESITNIDKL